MVDFVTFFGRTCERNLSNSRSSRAASRIRPRAVATAGSRYPICALTGMTRLGEACAIIKLGRDLAGAESRSDATLLYCVWAAASTEINQFGVVHTKAERLAEVRS